MQEPSETTDRTLIEKTARGDQDAFASLIRRHQNLVLSIAYRFLGSRADAEDAAQEVFIRMWGAAPRYRPEAPLGAYLRTVAVNYCLDLKRKKIRLVTTAFEEEPGGTQDPHGEVEGLERGTALRAALQSLPASQRMAVVLFHFEGLDVREVARLLETSPKAVESLLSRARSALRERLHPLLLKDP